MSSAIGYLTGWLSLDGLGMITVIFSTRSQCMAKIWELLDQAHYLIRIRHFEEAQLILDEILRMEPQNMDAWDAYMRMCSTRGDFEGLKNHIRTIWATRVRDDDYLQAMQRFLLQRVDERMESV